MKQSAYDRVTQRVLELLEQGTCPWRRPWSQIPAPQNFITGKSYRGINLLLLGSMSFSSPFFLTFKQALDRGGCVRRGEKGIPVYYWGTFEPKGQKGARSEHDETKRKFFLKYYTVFNASQVDGVEFPEPEKSKEQEFEPIEAAQQIINDWNDGPEILHNARQAAYDPFIDVICMPDLKCFDQSAEYFSTLYHEFGHATGHPKRLNRDLSGDYGSASYGKEELIAEMTSAFLCAQCGIDNEVIDNQAAYLQGWMRAVRSDTRLVVTAAAQARKAADLILGSEESKEITAAKADAQAQKLRADALARQR